MELGEITKSLQGHEHLKHVREIYVGLKKKEAQRNVEEMFYISLKGLNRSICQFIVQEKDENAGRSLLKWAGKQGPSWYIQGDRQGRRSKTEIKHQNQKHKQRLGVHVKCDTTLCSEHRTQGSLNKVSSD